MIKTLQNLVFYESLMSLRITLRITRRSIKDTHKLVLDENLTPKSINKLTALDEQHQRYVGLFAANTHASLNILGATMSPLIR